MRNLLLFLGLAVAAILLVTVLLPILGLILVLLVGLLIVAVGFYFALPLLVKLPWFRDRIRVYRNTRGETIHFDNGGFYYSDMTTQEPPNPDETADPRPAGQLGQGDIIDVEGRDVPEDDDPKE
ncbi:MAG: hypothetical protein ACM3XM_14690 [Mycobacterium leprae]